MESDSREGNHDQGLVIIIREPFDATIIAIRRSPSSPHLLPFSPGCYSKAPSSKLYNGGNELNDF